jgi:hypothetical protein
MVFKWGFFQIFNCIIPKSFLFFTVSPGKSVAQTRGGNGVPKNIAVANAKPKVKFNSCWKFYSQLRCGSREYAQISLSTVSNKIE